MANGHGGKRKNTPKPPDKTGMRWPSTLAKEQARELVRTAITQELVPLIQAQVSNALGLKYLVVRGKDGKFKRIGPDALDRANEEGDTVEMWEKDPSIEALKELLNRALDQSPKPKESIEVDAKLEVSWKDVE